MAKRLSKIKSEEVEEPAKTETSYFNKIKVILVILGITYVVLTNKDTKMQGNYDEFLPEFFSLKNLIATLNECWLFIVVVILYLLARRYNQYLDKLEEEEMAKKESDEDETSVEDGQEAKKLK